MAISDVNSAGPSFRGEIGLAIRDMLYISETEAGLELLPAREGLASQDAVKASLGGAASTEDAEHFLQSIRDSVDPGDEGLRTYLQQWEDLFRLLKSRTDDICVYRHGPTIDIAAITQGEAAIIRTAAVET